MQANELQFYQITQCFESEHIHDIEHETLAQINASGVSFATGSRIAIAVGSRGVANIDKIVRTTVQAIRAQGAYPFIIPAMGSHGGATPEGQRAMLEGYGVTEEYTGAPIVSSMQVVELKNPGYPFHVYMSKDAYEADGVVIINRVKLHTDFHGPVESGLMKMCVIGLGKHAQALEIHQFGVYGLREYIPIAAKRVLASGKILMGIGLVENAYDQTMVIRAAAGNEIEKTDAELLAIARGTMPSLPCDMLDLLIVDHLGKDISGTGMDTNIIGRMRILGQEEPKFPNISYIIASKLTPASHGNALGMGLADFITKRFHDDIDYPATAQNVMTSSFVERGRMPMVAENDLQAVNWALRAIGIRNPDTLRAARIRSTLELGTLQVSAAVLKELETSPEWTQRNMVVQSPAFSPFDSNGTLLPWMEE